MTSLRTWAAAWPGLLATLSGVGFARFAYTALIPFLIGAGQVTPVQAAYLGAANLGGYLIGALIANALAVRLGPATAIRGAFAVTALGLALCIIPGGFWWLFPWRALAGVSGAMLMVLGPSSVLARTAPAERGRTGGVIFVGVGLGTGLATLMVAPLAAIAPAWAWTGLSLGAALATLASWRRWEGGVAAAGPGISLLAVPPMAPALLFAVLCFGIDGAGFVPHTVFWVDFVARELDRGLVVGNGTWLLFALGAALGPAVAGMIGDRIGLGPALIAAFLIKSIAIALPAKFTATPVLAFSAFAVGALAPGIAALSAARVAGLVQPGEHIRVWGLACLAFACTQAAAAYGFSYAYAATLSYQPLFLAAAAIQALGILFALGTTFARRV